MSRNHQSIKNKYAAVNAGTKVMSVGEYVERCEARKNYPGRIRKGKMFIKVNGNWVTQKEFDKLVPAPIVFNFEADITNCDTRKLWMI